MMMDYAKIEKEEGKLNALYAEIADWYNRAYEIDMKYENGYLSRDRWIAAFGYAMTKAEEVEAQIREIENAPAGTEANSIKGTTKCEHRKDIRK